MTAVLNRFRVRNFRSVSDSKWIDTSNLTALIGTNEAGKTNLLLPLWKLNPANKEPIDPLIDYPRPIYSSFKADGDDQPFIEAEFQLHAVQAKELSKKLKIAQSFTEQVRYSRHWDKSYKIVLLAFENNQFDGPAFSSFLQSLVKLIEPFGEFEGALEVKDFFHGAIERSRTWSGNIHTKIIELLERFDNIEYEAEEIQEKAIQSVIEPVRKLSEITAVNGELTGEYYETVLKYLPAFVYYSDYGNLNSEIYLPRVIEDLSRKNLKGIDRDRARTLKVLFDFVKLTPKEILELGKEQAHSNTKEEETIAEEAKRKKEREVLLQSASTKMTKDFRNWWKQGDYRFRFDADGNHFRIWVSDEKRPEEIELESRSRGLQWFFSFFLVFLVESQDEHTGCILLLDEPGVTLHPIAQEDLIKFFKSLSQDSQVVYTTHSPFLIDSNNLGQVKAVYIDDEGHSAVSSDLRKGSKVSENSIYPVHAAIGLSISETFLNGCQPVLVEGHSDQVYLHAIKSYLQKKGLLGATKELVFIPTGGVKGMKPIINIISGKDAQLPFVVLDSDLNGTKMKDTLAKDLYSSQSERIFVIKDLLGVDNTEIEDLFPNEMMADALDRKYRVEDTALIDEIEENSPFLVQAETYFKKNSIVPADGWKVDLAKEMEKKLQRKNAPISQQTEEIWKNLFDKLSDIKKLGN
ncbi:AAA family ATPase [Paraflavisolibacter sp. H34]|uniref:AAA family ATPase n=1 Tax=Huijunlia imazamoxiresistens TaxID=3127457 RepID=UPI003016DD33